MSASSGGPVAVMVGGIFHDITCSSLASTATAREKHNEDLTGGRLYDVPVLSSFVSPLGVRRVPSGG